MSVRSILKTIKKSFIAVVGAAVVAGSLVALPAEAAVAYAKMPAKTVDLGADHNDSAAGRLVTKDGWIYSLQGVSQNFSVSDSSSDALALKRTKASTFGTAVPITLIGRGSVDASKVSVGDTITKLYSPISFDIADNTVFILDRTSNNSVVRLVTLDLTGATDTTANLTGTVVAVTGSGLAGYTYGVTSIAAFSDSLVFYSANNSVYKMTKSGSTWSSENPVSQDANVFAIRGTAEGKLVVASSYGYGGAMYFKVYATTDLTTPVASVTLPQEAQYILKRQTDADIAIDPNTGDILFVQGDGMHIVRLVKKQDGSFEQTATYEAFGGVDSYTGGALTPTPGAPQDGSSYFDVTVSESTTNLKVGQAISFGDYTCSQAGNTYCFNSNGSATINAINGSKLTIKIDGYTYASGVATMKINALNKLAAVTGLVVDGTLGLVALDRGSINESVSKSRLITFKARTSLSGMKSLTVRGGHKSLTIDANQPAFTDDLDKVEIFLFEGATRDAAFAAATAHLETGKTPVCSFNKDFNSANMLRTGSYDQCIVVENITAGKFYGVAAKLTALDGLVSWHVSNSSDSVTDTTYSATLPTEPDPAASNVGPGYAHDGTTSGTGNALLASGFKRKSISDGRGGQYIAFLTGADFTSLVKMVRVLSTGAIDDSFGTNGVLTLPAETTNFANDDMRAIQLAWYGAEGRFVYLDHDSNNNQYLVNVGRGSNSVDAWTMTDAKLNDVCANQFSNASSNSVNYGEVVPVSAASSDPIFEVTCNANYRQAPNNYTDQITLSLPVYVKLTANNTLSVFAKVSDQVTSYADAQQSTTCYDSYSYYNRFLASANPASGQPLFTSLAKTYQMSNGNCSPWMATPAATSIRVAADGTVTKVNNNLPVSNMGSIVNTWITSTGKAYLEIDSGMTSNVVRLTSEGVLDTTLGNAGTLAIAAPACAGAVQWLSGISEKDGNVYLNGFAWTVTPGNGMSQNIPPVGVSLFGILVEKASGSSASIGSNMLGAKVTFNIPPRLNSTNYWGEVGSSFATTTINANGDVSLLYYAGAAGVKSVKFDSFTSALPAGDDYIVCPPAPFEAVEAAAPFTTMSSTLTQMTDGNIFGYAAGYGQVDNKAVIYTPGANNNLKGGSLTLTEASNGAHLDGWAVALPGNKVLVGGGRSNMGNASKTLEIYDPSAAAGSKWTVLTGANGATDLLLTASRSEAVVQLLSNGKVLVFGGRNNAGIASGELITIGGPNETTVTQAFTAADVDNVTYSSITPAGAGKWLLAGISRYDQTSTSTATKIYTESTGALTAGPALSVLRRDPAVVAISATKTMFAGDSPSGMSMPGAGTQSYDIYDSTTNKIETKTLKPGQNGYFASTSGFVMPSGKVLMVSSMMNMDPSVTKVLDLTDSSMTVGEKMVAALRGAKYFKFGDQTLIAGGMSIGMGGPGTPAWQVFTEPAAAVQQMTADVRKVLKGTTGNIVFTSGVDLNLTGLSVSYANGTGNVLKIVPAPVTGSKLKLDATKRKLTVALPATAQLNAAGVGTVIATVKQGTAVLGSVTINYVAVKDTPAFAGGVPSTIPGNVGRFTLDLSTSVGNGVPTLGYKSSTTKVCTVAADGTVTRVSRGVCKVTVSQAADLGTNAKSQDYTFTFSKSVPVLAFGNATPAAGNIDLTEDDVQIALAATIDGQPAVDLDVTYAIDNDDRCSIDEEGVLNTLALGTCTVTVSYAGDANTNAATSITRTFTIVTPSQENPGTIGGVIGDAVFEAKDSEDDTMLTASVTIQKHVKRTIKFGRGWKIIYTPTIKAKTTNVVTGANFQPTMTASYIGTMTSTFTIPKAAFAKTPSGWKVVGTNYQCVMTFGSKTQVAANKKIKTVTQKPAKAGCALPALTAPVQVKIKNNWTRLGQKKGSPVLTAQKRTVKINLQ